VCVYVSWHSLNASNFLKIRTILSSHSKAEQRKQMHTYIQMANK
jgi:hypothetical protein